MFHEEYICDELSHCLFLLNNSPNDKQLYPFTFHVRNFPNTEYERRDGIICRLDRDMIHTNHTTYLKFCHNFWDFWENIHIKGYPNDIQSTN